MRRITMVLSLLMLSMSLLVTVTHAAELRYKGTMGYLLDGLDDAKYKDAQLAFDMWMRELAKDEGIEATVNYYESDTEIIRDFEPNRIDLMTINSFYYLVHRETIDKYAKEFWAVQRNASWVFERLAVLVRRDSGIKSLADLKARRIVGRSDDYIGRMVLDTELLRHVHTPMRGYVDTILGTKSYNTAILKTFFGKADACIVPESNLVLASEMNPVLGREMISIFTSEEIYTPILSIYHKETDLGLLDAFRRNAAQLETTPRGQNILDLFKMKKIFQIDPSTLGPLKAYYQEYIKLRSLYGADDE